MAQLIPALAIVLIAATPGKLNQPWVAGVEAISTICIAKGVGRVSRAPGPELWCFGCTPRQDSLSKVKNVILRPFSS